ncbi:rod shape-determining protein MreD [Symbiobacterium terraclitae]|uniref:Rod shape-determining protein MreD n=1 Tax=Symbiobacterium terraclitae TaxID=557451 RepID=A0ABS4JUE5_9FIRM|nr:rod shape-determining protein MreD [Symbiobacterium terraclitae]MBP2019157.1 rod shape-determining protein MreD [Symbiobacterium terraclitae]
MRYWALSGIVLAAYLVQTVLGPYLAIGGVIPNVVLVVAVTCGLLFGWQVGLAAGFAGGLLIDLTLGILIGSHALALGTVGFLAGLIEPHVFKDNPVLAALGGVLGSLLGQSFLALFLFVFGHGVFLAEFRSTLLRSLVYDTLLCLLVYWRIHRRYNYLKPDPRGTIVLRRR